MIRCKSMMITMMMVVALVLVSCKADQTLEQTRNRNINTVKTFLRLLEEEKIEDYVDLYAADGKQVNPYASGLFPKEVKGREALLKFWKPVPSRFDGMTFPIEKISPMLDPNLVLAEFKGKIKLKDNAGYYENHYYCLFKFDEAGKITEYVEIFNPLEWRSSNCPSESISSITNGICPSAWVAHDRHGS